MIVFHSDGDKLTVDGHACHGAYGTDIVCSAVSILVFTAAQDGTMEGTPGHAVVRSESVQFAVTGLRLLADQYPDFVKEE